MDHYLTFSKIRAYVVCTLWLYSRTVMRHTRILTLWQKGIIVRETLVESGVNNDNLSNCGYRIGLNSLES